jgi:hypothetical protein
MPARAGNRTLLLANGFSRQLLAALVRDRQVVPATIVVRSGSKAVPVTHMKITAAGRKALLIYPSALGA